MMQVSLLAFLKTGLLGNIQPGISRDQLKSILGAPPNWMNKYASTSPIWKYGDIEFHFDEQHRVWMIFSDHFRPDLKGDCKFEIDCWILIANLTLDEAKLALTAENIPYQIKFKPVVRLYDLLCESGTTLSFESNEDGVFTLGAIFRKL